MQPVQIKMARAALGLSLAELADQAGLSAAAIGQLEEGVATEPAVSQGLSLFLASHGIELIDDDGVRAKQRPATSDSITVDNLTTDNDGGQG